MVDVAVPPEIPLQLGPTSVVWESKRCKTARQCEQEVLGMPDGPTITCFPSLQFQLHLASLLPRKILNVFTDQDGDIRVKEDNLREVLRPEKTG